MLAYHNDPKLRESVINEMAIHRKADELVQGNGYWKDGNGCAVGCLIKGHDHFLYESKFGIPEMLARLEDAIFEGLPKLKAQEWPEHFLSAIKSGQDLSLVGWEFQHRLQINNLKFAKKQKFSDDVIKAIELVIDVLEPMTKGKKVDESAAVAAWAAAAAAKSESAAAAAESAARSPPEAAWSPTAAAELAARSVAWAAATEAELAWAEFAESAELAWAASESAYEEMADLLIEIIEAH